MRTLRVFGTGLLLFTAVAALGIVPLSDKATFKEIGRTTEKELNVVLSSSFGSVVISKGEPEKVVLLEARSDTKNDPRMSVSYAIRNRVGYLDISLGERSHEEERKKGSFSIAHFGGGKWHLRFTDAIPISLELELGVGKGDFDLSGLRVKDFTLSTGASEVRLSFDTKNKASIENINIESGVSKFTGWNLGNANFKHFRFEGGVGAYTLDFSGELEHEADVDVEVGLGVLTLIVPPEVGARVLCEQSWVSRVDFAKDFQTVGKDQYETENYSAAAGKMNIRIDSGLGSVKIRRR